jgi:hypothetical protein
LQVEVREHLLSFGVESLSSSVLCKITKIKINRTLLLPLILYGSHTFREEWGMRVSENWMLWRMFVSKRDEVTGEW